MELSPSVCERLDACFQATEQQVISVGVKPRASSRSLSMLGKDFSCGLQSLCLLEIVTDSL